MSGPSRKHLRERFGRLRLQDVSEDEIASFLAAMRNAGNSGHTIRAVLTPLSRCLGRAARRGMIPSNPVRKLEAETLRKHPSIASMRPTSTPWYL